MREAIERMQSRFRELEAETASETLRMRAQRQLEHAERELDRAVMRDAIQATRPTGCWCLGTGGKVRRYMLGGDGDVIEVLSEYCQCPDGHARAAQDRMNREQHAAAYREQESRRIFTDAGVPARFRDAAFDSYPVSDATREALTTIREWSSHGSESLLIYGPFGTGKTGLAVAAMRQRIAESRTCALFLTTPGLLDRIRQTYNRKQAEDDIDEADVLAAIRDADLLVLDDLGAERPTDWVQEKLFTIINHRHDALAATIFTSNLDPEGLAKHLGERIAWRIIEMSQVVHLSGPNLRDRLR